MKPDLLKIIDYYGVNKQQRQLAEEVFELQEAITQYEEDKLLKRTGSLDARCSIMNGKTYIAEEIADVLVMLYQFMFYYDIDYEDIIGIEHYKVNRQLEIIKNEVKR